MRCLYVALIACGLMLGGCQFGLERGIEKADAQRGALEYSKAADSYRSLIDRYGEDPRSADVMLRLADLYLYHLHDESKARKEYQLLLQRWPLQSAAMYAYLRLAEIAQRQQRYVAAIESLELLLQYFPAYPERYQLRVRIGKLYVRTQRYAQAEVELRSVVEDERNAPNELRAEALFELAEVAALTGDVSGAIAGYRVLEEQYPDTPWATQAKQQAQALAEASQAPSEYLAPETLRRVEQALREDRVAGADDLGDRGLGVPAVDATIVLTSRTGRQVTVWAEIAATEEQRARGLMHRQYLPPAHGMWFIFPEPSTQSFWMKDTPLALDLIFVGSDFHVTEVIADTKPNSTESLQPKRPYRYVLEVAAGFTKEHHIAPGSRIVWTPKPAIGRWHEVHEHDH